MVLVINTIPFLQEKKTGNTFIYETLSRLIKEQPEHTFVLISEDAAGPFISSENVIHVSIGAAPKNHLKLLIWFHLKIKKVLKKHKAEIFISNGIGLLATKIPQIVIVPDLPFLHPQDAVNKKNRFFYKKFTPRFLQKAKAIIVFSQFEKANMIRHYKIEDIKIQVIYNGADEKMKPINFEEREKIKEKYAEGNEYFMYSGIISPQNNLVNLLKAFSVFKKRQRSSMQLFITGEHGNEYSKFLKSLEQYKFKNKVKLWNGIPPSEIEKITAASYAMVYPSPNDTTDTAPFAAMKCGVPVLISSTGIMHEICAEAVWYFDPKNYKDIAEKMMMIFKDEKLRKELIEKGKEQVKKYNWSNSAVLLWEKIKEITE